MGTGKKNRSSKVADWYLHNTTEVLQEIPHLKGPPVFPSLARNCSRSKPSNQESSLLNNSTRIRGKGAA